jgi:hypothetical protein
MGEDKPSIVTLEMKLEINSSLCVNEIYSEEAVKEGVRKVIYF